METVSILNLVVALVGTVAALMAIVARYKHLGERGEKIERIARAEKIQTKTRTMYVVAAAVVGILLLWLVQRFLPLARQ